MRCVEYYIQNTKKTFDTPRSIEWNLLIYLFSLSLLFQVSEFATSRIKMKNLIENKTVDVTQNFLAKTRRQWQTVEICWKCKQMRSAYTARGSQSKVEYKRREGERHRAKRRKQLNRVPASRLLHCVLKQWQTGPVRGGCVCNVYHVCDSHAFLFVWPLFINLFTFRKNIRISHKVFHSRQSTPSAHPHITHRLPPYSERTFRYTHTLIRLESPIFINSEFKSSPYKCVRWRCRCQCQPTNIKHHHEFVYRLFYAFLMEFPFVSSASTSNWGLRTFIHSIFPSNHRRTEFLPHEISANGANTAKSAHHLLNYIKSELVDWTLSE